jgi:hypothetical protein
MSRDYAADARKMRTSDLVQLIVTYTTLPPRTNEEAESRQRIKEAVYAELDARLPPRG